MDALLSYISRALPEQLVSELSEQFDFLEKARFEELLSLPLAKLLLGQEDSDETRDTNLSDFGHNWSDFIRKRVEDLVGGGGPSVSDQEKDGLLFRQHVLFFIAVAALQAFVQSNITGPPLKFNSSTLLFTPALALDQSQVASVREGIINSLSVDGEAAYKLVPNVELLCLAKIILTYPTIKQNVSGAEWANLRVNFLHQRILSERSSTLQECIYDSLESLDDLLALSSDESKFTDLHSSYLLEKATIHIHFGLDQKARDTLDDVIRLQGFQFALTGVLGKRTKYQERDTSQLVVLAKSNRTSTTDLKQGPPGISSNIKSRSEPKALNLNDDTLLESISFSKGTPPSVEFVDKTGLPEALATLDPENQPLLHPLDSIILLSLASSITNTQPADGLTREETIPYATRVLDGGSSNWQIYTQALLLRSRIEGYRSRTTERGLLQLQALVDQVIAEMSGNTDSTTSDSNGSATTFLPRPKASKSAPATERLLYIYELCSPTRWELEAELAARWVSLGGLRTALEIYHRLEMWAEEALCWASIDREDKARRIIRKQLFHASSGNDTTADPEKEQWDGPPRDPQPNEAPRLYCILGDIDQDVSKYEKAWEVSKNRYARAQRSISTLR